MPDAIDQAVPPRGARIGAEGSPGPSSPISRRGLLVAMVLTVAGMTLLAVLALEVGLRLFVAVRDVPVRFFDPVTGPRTMPNQRGRWIKDDDINASYRFNAQGWNHPEDYEIRKPRGTRRVCIVGDSQVESLQVEADQTLYAVAQKAMSRADRPVQWYAFGNSGFGTAQEHETIRHYVLDYRPDVVILFFIQNDPFDCSPYLVHLEPHVPVYTLDSRDNLILWPPAFWSPSWKGRLALESALFRYFVAQKDILHRFSAGGKARGIGGLPLREATGTMDDPRVPDLGRLSARERERMTWLLIEKLFASLRDECRRRGAAFAIAFRGWTPDIESPRLGAPPPPAPKDQDPYCMDQDKRLSEMGRDIVGPMARRLGIPYLDLTDALRAAVAQSGRSHTFRQDNHMNALAHEAAGKAMAAWIEPLLEKPPAVAEAP